MTLIQTKDNQYTTIINNTTIHSKYAPSREAEKFLSSKLKKFHIVIVLGAGLGYLYTEILKKNPEVKIIAIPYNYELSQESLKLNPTPRIQWDFKEDLYSFLSSYINEFNIKDLEIIEWEPSALVFNTISREINDIIAKKIRVINGNLLTTARFGKLWLKNSLKNYINIESYISDIKINKPIVIIASGRSLNLCLPYLKEVREYVTVISLSSANMALKKFDIKPDITFSTDPGYYSKLHIYNTKNIVAMPFSNCSANNNEVLLLNQNNFFENELLDIGKIPNFKINENGTVAGTALEFALKYSNSKIYLIGQDLGSSDFNTHVSPYSFDKLLINDSSRIKPFYTIKYRRFMDQGYTYNTYYDWFSKTGKNNPNRIYRVNSNGKEIINIKDITFSDFKLSLLKNEKPTLEFNFFNPKNKKNRTMDVIKLLEKWLNDINNQENYENQLFYLISTAKYTDVRDKTTENLLKNEIIQESTIYLKRLLQHYGKQLL